MKPDPSRRSIFKGILAAPVAATVGGAVAQDPWAFGIDPYGLPRATAPMVPGMFTGADTAGFTNPATSGYAELVGEQLKPKGSSGTWDEVWTRSEKPSPRSPAARQRRLASLRSMSEAARWAYGQASPPATTT